MGVEQPDPVRPSKLSLVVAPSLVLLQASSLQVGSAVAKHTYGVISPTALAGMRLVFSAGLLCLLVRPRLRQITVQQWRAVILLGVVFAGMNMAYFQAIRHLPLGVASTLELLGPLLLSVALSRRLQHLLSGMLAVASVLLLTAPGGELSALGICLGLLAALCRAAYVVLSRRVGALFADWTGLTVALVIGACIVAPIAGVTDGAEVAAHPKVLVTGLFVALLSSLIPYSLDMVTLRRIDVRAFGVLLALSPAVAVGVGFFLLDEHLTLRQVCAIALIMISTAWAVVVQPSAAPISSSDSTPSVDERHKPPV
ncbi:DMT family transporter [Streptomyces sp. NPDC058682]|uniref:EamA family transporter n=1 Tax=unclassified Streptomyces TaxID=2593676 RepID=UPI002250384B|nr:EamA family transporter [Streptomyces sp. NBC_01214]MCX4805305.1 EamA family transporter [Streptomyces sp. NBC_01214]